MYSREATNEQQQQLKQPLCAAKEINRMATILREYQDSTATPDSSSADRFHYVRAQEMRAYYILVHDT